MRSVMGVGLLALDVIVSEPDSELASAYAGGTCGNVLSILSYLGWIARPVGSVGNDGAGRRVLADLERWKLRLDRLVVDESFKTPVFVQTLRRDLYGSPRHHFTTECPSCGGLLEHSRALRVPVLDLSADNAPDYFFMDRLSESIVQLARVAKAHGASLIYEPSSQADRQFWNEVWPLIDVLKYSEDRFSPRDFETAGQELRNCWEIETRGGRGLRFRAPGVKSSSEWRNLTAIDPPRLVDTCGAGDWTTAGLMFALADKFNDPASARIEDFESALRWGQASASWACSFEGARGAMYASSVSTTHAAIEALRNGAGVRLDLPELSATAYANVSPVCEAVHGHRHRSS